MTQQRTSRKANGHPGPNGRPNGHGPAYTPAYSAGKERGGGPQPVCSDRPRNHAASDDASRTSVASAEALPATASLQRQASTVCQAYAEVAPPPPNERSPQTSATNNTAANQDKPNDKELPPGKYPLPDKSAEFVQEIHRKIDLIEVWHSLLRNGDEKVRQRAVEKLTSMLYDDDSISAEEPQQIVMDIDSAVARRAIAARQKEL